MNKTQDSPYNHWCCQGCNGAKPLTLADRELITGRMIAIAVQDEDGSWFCGDCLADLPSSQYEAGFHVCGQDGPEAVEAAPAIVHKTRTTRPVGYNQDADGVRRFDKRGRVMHDRGSFWICSCGQMGGRRDAPGGAGQRPVPSRDIRCRREQDGGVTMHELQDANLFTANHSRWPHVSPGGWPLTAAQIAEDQTERDLSNGGEGNE